MVSAHEESAATFSKFSARRLKISTISNATTTISSFPLPCPMKATGFDVNTTQPTREGNSFTWTCTIYIADGEPSWENPAGIEKLCSLEIFRDTSFGDLWQRILVHSPGLARRAWSIHPYDPFLGYPAGVREATWNDHALVADYHPDNRNALLVRTPRPDQETPSKTMHGFMKLLTSCFTRHPARRGDLD